MKNDMLTNVLGQDDVVRKSRNVMEYICSILGQTMGPYGKNIILQDQQLQHFCSKDGYTVLNRISIKGEFERTILDFIKKVSGKLNRTVGDGTTTATVVSTCLYNNLLSWSDEFKIPTNDIIRELDLLKNLIIDRLVESSTKIDEDNFNDMVFKIAKVSGNNDESIAKIVLDAYTEVNNGMVQVKLGNSSTDKISFSSGIEHFRGLIRPEFINNGEKQSFDAAGNVEVFMSDTMLTSEDIKAFSQILQQSIVVNGAALVICAPGFDDHFINFLVSNMIAQSKKGVPFPVCPVEVTTNSADKLEHFNDISTLSNCSVFLRSTYKSLQNFIASGENYSLGNIDEITVGERKTVFSGMSKKANVESRIKRINNEIDRLENIEDHIDRSLDISKLRTRVNNLDIKGMATIHVGGVTEQERKTRFFLMEDAIYAVRSALKHGFVNGCSMSIPFIVNDLLSDETLTDEQYTLLDNISIAFVNAYETVLSNGISSGVRVNDIITKCYNTDMIYNLITQDYEKAHNCSVINSVETDIEVLNTAVSIIGLLITSSSFISSATFFENDE